MTWLKLSDDYSDMLDELSDAAYRTHTEALNLAMKRERGPILPKPLLLRHMNSARAVEAIAELLDAGMWVDLGPAYRVLFGMEHQPEPDVIAARKLNDAERQRRRRRKLAGLSDPDPSRRDTPRDVTPDVRADYPRDPGRVGSGLEKHQLGQEQERAPSSRSSPQPEPWPTFNESSWTAEP